MVIISKTLKIIGEGAEAQIYEIKTESNMTILKKIRIKKPYKLPKLDLKQRKSRNRREYKILTKLYENRVRVPKPIELIEEKQKDEYCFLFEKIDGEILKNILNNPKIENKEKNEILIQFFEEIIKMHNLNIVHNDLTTMNAIKSKKDGQIYIIDFGLSKVTTKIENKAEDLNLLFNCIKNEHQKQFNLKKKLLNIYKEKANFGEKIIKRLYEIEQRGRNKKKNKKLNNDI